MDWLKLTDEDIERAESLARNTPPMPPVLRIGRADLTADSRNTIIAPRLKITELDLNPVAPQTNPPESLANLERLAFDLINEARKAQLPSWLGNTALKWHEKLAAVARGHSADMAERQYVEHKSPEGTTASMRIETYGIRYIACGENIGVVYGFASHSDEGVREIHKSFMNQPRSLTNHRGNLLNPIWTHVGVGVAYKPEGVLYMTQNFISLPGSR